MENVTKSNINVVLDMWLPVLDELNAISIEE